MKEQTRKSEPVTTTSANILEERIANLREIFPESFTEGKVDFEKLRASLGDRLDDRPERYSFSWAGKRDAIRLLQTPTRATLASDREESVNFDATQNIFIEGDNLEVLKLLYKPYFGRVKMIYIDPPYNTGNDFIYPDNYTDPLETYLQITGQKDVNDNLLTSNPETSGRYHSAWLSMMYPRLFLARQLLSEDGLIFVSIDDHEVYDLRLIMNEIFGEENFLATFVWKRRASSALADKLVSVDHEYVIAFQRGSFRGFLGKEKDYSNYSNPDNDPNGPWTLGDLTVGMTKEQRPNQFYDLVDPKTGKKFPANPNRVWAFIRESMAEQIALGHVVFPEDIGKRPMLKRYKKNLKSSVNPISTWIKGSNESWEESNIEQLESGLTSEGTKLIQGLFGATVFNYSKPVSLITSLAKYTTTENDLILDFFAGSCSTAQAILELNRLDGGNRRFIMVQLPESTDKSDFPTITEIGKERIRRIVKDMQQTDEGQLALETPNEDLGFKVFKLKESNFLPWKGTENDALEDYAQQMALFTDPLIDGWKPENVVYEVALKEGYGLNSRIEQLPNITNNSVYKVTDLDKEQSFIICLDDTIHREALTTLGLGKDDLFICRDIALDDETAANLALQCRLKTI